MDLFDGIRGSYLAEGLSDNQVMAIAAIVEEANYADKEEVVREFETATEVFVLLEGKVRVTTSTGEFIARLKPGQIIGEQALFEQAARSASVIAEGPCRLARIPADRFQELVYGKPEIGVRVLMNVGRTICSRLRSSNIQLESVLAAL